MQAVIRLSGTEKHPGQQKNRDVCHISVQSVRRIYSALHETEWFDGIKKAGTVSSTAPARGGGRAYVWHILRHLTSSSLETFLICG